jgi:hypothetical protein
MTSYSLGGSESESRSGREMFIFLKISRPALDPTQHPIHWIVGYFPGVEWLVCKVNHSFPSSPGVKNVWIHTSTVLIRLHGMDRKKFAFCSGLLGVTIRMEAV